MSNVSELKNATEAERIFADTMEMTEFKITVPNLTAFSNAQKETLRPGDDPNVAAVKFDQGKTRLDLVPIEGITAVGEILGVGAQKYGDRNWEKGMDWSRPYGACLRHLFAWWNGEDRDPDTGRSHLWHATTNLFFLIAYEKRGSGKDDRPALRQ